MGYNAPGRSRKARNTWQGVATLALFLLQSISSMQCHALQAGAAFADLYHNQQLFLGIDAQAPCKAGCQSSFCNVNAID